MFVLLTGLVREVTQKAIGEDIVGGGGWEGMKCWVRDDAI
jgi:hypothetical protein